MSFSKLYAYVQTLEGRISRATLREKIVELTGENPRVFHCQMNVHLIRGLFIMADEGTRWNEWAGGRCVILVARDQDDTWKRFVEIKELMHVFDGDLDYVGTDTDFENLLEYLTSPAPKLVGQNHLSDNLAIIMALASVCPEAKRQEYTRLLDSGEISVDQVAKQIDIPPMFIPWLVHPHFKGMVKSYLDLCADR